MPKLSTQDKGISYFDAKKIYKRVCAAWRIHLSNGSVRLLLTDENMTIEEVISYFQTHNTGRFSVGQVSVGEYVIDKTLNEYRADGRLVTDSMEVTIHA